MSLACGKGMEVRVYSCWENIRMTGGTNVRMTLNYILDSSREKYSDLKAIGMAMEEAITYEELHQRVLALAHYLNQYEKIEKGDRIAILAENSDRWGVAYLATVRLGAVAIPILPDLPESDVHHILHEMKVKAMFTTQRQIEKLYEFSAELDIPVVTLDDYNGQVGVINVKLYSEYLQQALTKWAEDIDADDVSFPDVGEDDLAAILYTSGTSGYSKAVMLSHKNLTSNAYAASTLLDVPPGSVFLSILPISHTYEFTCGFVLPLLVGAKIAYAGKTPTPAILHKFCQHEKPFVIFAVPLVMEKIYKKRVLPKIESSAALSLISKIGMGRKFIHKRSGQKLKEFLAAIFSLWELAVQPLILMWRNFFMRQNFHTWLVME